MKKINLTKRKIPLSDEEWNNELKFWGKKAKLLRESSLGRSIVDWDKINKMVLK